MGIVGSLPSSPSPVSTDNMKTLYEGTIPSCDECSYRVTTVNETDSTTNSSTTLSTADRNTPNDRQSPEEQNHVTVAYGPITVKVRHLQPPTLATGRRSKFLELEGDAAAKRELRRKRNRDAAKRLKEKRTTIEQQLEKDIEELEFKERELMSRVKNLETHKEQLETQYEQITAMRERLAKTASSTLQRIERNRRRFDQDVSVYRNEPQIKEEPRSPSPQWQLFFSI